jgi:hypothetical protein
MLPPIFPTPADKDRMDNVKKYSDLYENKAFQVLGLHELIKKQFKNLSQLVYIAHSIPSKVSEFYGDFVQGDATELSIESQGEQGEAELIVQATEDNDLVEAVYDYGVDQSSIGFLVLLARSDEAGHLIIDAVPQDQYFPQKDGSVIFGSYLQVPGSTDPKELWLYTQHYRMDEGKAVIDRELWTVNSLGQKQDKIDLAKYDANLKELEPLGIDELPIVQIDNGRRIRGFGKSDYADILPQLAEVNERTTHVAIQLLKNLDAKLTGPKGMLDEKTGKPVQWEVMERENNEQPKPEYVLNDNPLIAETYKHVEKQLQYISWFTGVPMFELLSTSANPERVEALRMRLYSAIRKTDTKRSKLKKGLKDILRKGLKLMGITEPADIDIRFGDVLPKDTLTDTQAEQIKVQSGLSSKRSSIKRLENYDDEQVDAELATIEQENRVAGIDPANPPTI